MLFVSVNDREYMSDMVNYIVYGLLLFYFEAN